MWMRFEFWNCGSWLQISCERALTRHLYIAPSQHNGCEQRSLQRRRKASFCQNMRPPVKLFFALRVQSRRPAISAAARNVTGCPLWLQFLPQDRHRVGCDFDALPRSGEGLTGELPVGCPVSLAGFDD
jgi:hypothetical protein